MELDLPEGHGCGSTVLPRDVVETCKPIPTDCPTDPALCQTDFECDERLLAGLECVCMHRLSAVLSAPAANTVPSGPYASALSVAIAAAAEKASKEEPRILGRAAVSGYLVWKGETPCNDLVSQNSSTILADWQQGQPVNDGDANQREIPSYSSSDMLLMTQSLRCVIPDVQNSQAQFRAVQVPPSLQATHYLVQFYVLKSKNTCSELGSGGCAMLSDSAQFDPGRRLFQVDEPDLTNGRRVLEETLQSDSQAAKEAMISALRNMTQFTGQLSQDTLDDPLPKITPRENDSAQPSASSPRAVWIWIGVLSAILLIVLAVGCVRWLRRRPSPSPRTYVAGAQGASEPMLPDERREQLKGLLNVLRTKRTEEVTRARTRPLGEPVELGPEPVARTKVEHIVKALLCASAPGPIVAAEFP